MTVHDICRARRASVLVLLTACGQRGGATTPAVDSSTAVAIAVRAAQTVVDTAAGGLTGTAAADSDGFLVTVRPVCDTASGVAADGRAYRRGCGGGDATVRVARSGTASVLRRGE